jgi:hypothetical protein
MSGYLDLLDYRRRVAEMYAGVRAGSADSRTDPAQRLHDFRRARDELFRQHPQSALSPEQRARFRGLQYYPYDPTLRFTLPVSPADDDEVLEMHLRDDGVVRLRRLGRVTLTIAGTRLSLTLFWMLGYGGGVFLPFRDASNADETYEGGRYLLDTIKGADLGSEDGELVLDFNYAYNPSCAYDPRWECPLAPPENRLPVAIRAGEKRYPDHP